MSFPPSALLAFALTSAPVLAQAGFVFDVQLDVVGTVANVVSPLAAPLDGVATGDSVLMHLELIASDAPCTTTSGLIGYAIRPTLCSLDIGQARVGVDPMTAPCFLGEEFVFMVGAVRTEAAFDLEAGLGSVELELLDPGGREGISVFEILANPLVVADVTDPSFAATFEIRGPSGGPGITIDLEQIEGLQLLNSICSVVPNSTGLPTRLYSRGSRSVATNDFVLGAIDLPPSSFALFLTSQTSGFAQTPGNSAGNLCIGGAIGRFDGPGQILSTGAGGPIELQIDLTALPQPTGPVSVTPSDTWIFTLWYRDLVGTTSSNFGAAAQVGFF